MRSESAPDPISPGEPRGLPPKVIVCAIAWILAAAAFGASAERAHAAEASNGEAPIPAATLALMAARETTPAAPVLIRSYKKEAEMEVWKLSRNGWYVLLKTFPICRWSGQLGPKISQGDRQTPEGFYSVGPKQMNPNSHYYLSFDTGYPNAYDRAHGGSGSYLMVHGTCSSAGCYAMTDRGVGEIYAIVRDALRGGQAAFQFQAFPFRMSAQNIARRRSDPNIEFWHQLKEGSDRFEATGEEASVAVAAGRYVFGPSKDPAREALAKARLVREAATVRALIAEGSPAIKTTYSDGGQHPAFAALARQGANLGEISRPEALAYAGIEEVVTPPKPKWRPCLGQGACAPLALRLPVAADANPALANVEPAALARSPLGYKVELLGPSRSLIGGSQPILSANLTD
ncbi:L,D-transpeptidase family protein [Methylocapsa palsarum]|uniref:Murein L,D-transpeptidase YafK n=1 Tax=Methylocapsa palsarum TaxID=1612308 RepID=A0A1I3XVS0_9HYPH|nr:murein L,D-transpeptidase family protein [Methylocapsa palsarum]SFK23630.1 Murein L,D-transpeptidase YafK [Methylocapsa palsarum]